MAFLVEEWEARKNCQQASSLFPQQDLILQAIKAAGRMGPLRSLGHQAEVGMW